MIQRTLGKTGWKVSAIGFGAWGIGGQWGPVQRGEAMETIKAAYYNGVNFFDTADAYGEPQGLSEELMGKALKSSREKVIIASKVGNWGRRHGHPLPYTHPVHVIGCCDASLHRLCTDRIDVYQCHIANLKEPDVFLEAFEILMKQGKIRAWGMSTDSLEVLKAFNREGTCATVQLDYSLVNRSAEKELLPYCQEANIGVIVRGPLAKGIATGKFTRETKFTDSVRSGWNEGERREKFLKQVELVEKLKWLENPGRPMAHAALQFVISHPAVSSAIPGAKSPEQAKSNAEAGRHVLDEKELEQVRQVLERQG
jgi:myo-inositol catabolism protein IolS